MDSIGKVLKKQGYKFEQIKNETPEERQVRLKQECEKKCKSLNETVGNLDKQDGYNCDICKNKGYTFFAKEVNGMYAEYATECKCMKTRRVINKLQRSGLKNIIKDYTFDKYKADELWQKTIKQIAIKFVKDEESPWFFIGGQSGCGKTHICTAIAAYYLKRNKSVRYMLWRDEIVKIKALVNDDEAYSRAIGDLKTAEVLYIDDLFKMGKDANGKVQFPTVADINIAFEILNYRYNNRNLITIISSERRILSTLTKQSAAG